MFKVRVLNEEVIKDVIDMKQVIEAIEEVYRLKSNQKTEVFDMVFHEFERGVADMDIKSGHLKGEDIFGLKIVSWFKDNEDKKLPMLIGTTMVFDSKSGMPIGMLNAEYITGMRTGAAGAIGSKYLARENSNDLLMVGAGHQATFQIAATLISMPNIKNVRIYDPIDSNNANKVAGSIKDILNNKFLSKYENTDIYDEISKKFHVNFEGVDNLETAVRMSDVIITATPSRKPLIMKEWVKKGTHFSCVGSDMNGKQEIDENILACARVYVDDMNQALDVGEIEIGIKNNTISKEDIICEIGDVIIGKKRED